MEEESVYQVEITPEAEKYYLDILEYFYKHHSADSADKKSEELLLKAISLAHHPHRGRIEDSLSFLGKSHRFLLYKYTQNRSIRIIYFVEEQTKTVYVTDFFPTKMNTLKIGRRNNPLD
ncbi:MAG: type II toxin-antitoxin system RelE/ParE family toxin [Cyclobacteriaceae bacterium]